MSPEKFLSPGLAVNVANDPNKISPAVETNGPIALIELFLIPFIYNVAFPAESL